MERLAKLITLLYLLGGPALAHHSFGAEYDGKRPVSISGVVTKIEWSNPHVYLTVDASDSSGRVTAMMVEGHPPNILRRTGWTRDVLKVNDRVSITGWASKDGSERMAGREVTFPDGKKLFLGPPSE
jgi:hypothetical protein